MPGKKATTMDIAKLAGVSQSTVSMILSRKVGASFSRETIERVFAAATQLNYQPVRKGREGITAARLIAVVTPTLANPYYATLLQELENEAVAKGYKAFFYTTYRDEAMEGAFLNLAGTLPFSGIVFAYMPYHRERVMALSLSTPVIIVSDRKDEFMDANTVELNSMIAGETLADYLLSLGHRRFAFITTPLRVANTQRGMRLAGVRNRVTNAGGRLDVYEAQKLGAEGNYKPEDEYQAGYTLSLKAFEKPGVTACVGVNDMVAYGILDAIESKGLHVPADCSVAGFDNVFPSRFNRINLTTVDSQLARKGRDAFDLLLRNIDQVRTGNGQPGIVKIEYRPQLVVGHTTAACPNIDGCGSQGSRRAILAGQ